MIIQLAILVDVAAIAAVSYWLGTLVPRRDSIAETRLEALQAAYEVDVAAWEAEREMYKAALSARNDAG